LFGIVFFIIIVFFFNNNRDSGFTNASAVPEERANFVSYVSEKPRRVVAVVRNRMTFVDLNRTVLLNGREEK